MIERTALRPNYSISKIIKGGWHLAGGHGVIDGQEAIADMLAFVESGITTFDCADIYTGVEELIGQFLRKHKDAFQSGSLPPVQIHTKYVPDYDKLLHLKKEDTEQVIDRSLKRLGVDHLDLVQFAWWDYNAPGYVETAVHLSELQQKGKIRFIGATNFNSEKLNEIIDAGVDIITHQVQYSVLDHRAGTHQQNLAQENDFTFLSYGSVAGGFLSDRYLGTSEPYEPLENRSLTKYKLIIDEFGSWGLFQQVLLVLRTIANKYNVGVAEVAIKYVLQKEKVSGAIVGARNRNHLNSLLKIRTFKLDSDDLNEIESLVDQSNGPKGMFYDLERDKTGKHGSIMKYNLNSED